jgi:ATP-dependent DNA helicase RecQ
MRTGRSSSPATAARCSEASAAFPYARRARSAAGGGDLSREAEQLFDRLRAWRLEAARRHGVPAYVIFHDATLREIARACPSSIEMLRGISGIGARKLAAYGDEIVALVRP